MRGSNQINSQDWDNDIKKMKLDMSMLENQLQKIRKVLVDDDKVTQMISKSSLLKDAGSSSIIDRATPRGQSQGKPNIAQLKRERVQDYRRLMQDIVGEVSEDQIRGGDAPIDFVMVIAFIFVLAFGIFIFMQMNKGDSTALPIASRGKRLD